mgnify:CR=1 FL=1
MQSDSKSKQNKIESWIADNYCLEKELTLEEKYNLIYKTEVAERQQEFEHDDKENTVGKVQIPKKEQTIEGTNMEKEDDKCVPLDIVPKFQQTEVWTPFTKVTDPLLRPQLFRHHSVKLMECFGEEGYKVIEDFSCPPSPYDEQLVQIHTKSGKWIRQSGLRPRFHRLQVDSGNKYSLCRLCPHKKWIPVQWFEQHIALAHGIMSFEDIYGSTRIIALPDPRALFCFHQTKDFKRYYGQCPNCRKWIRLGFPEVVRTFPKIVNKSRAPINYKQQMKEGLYTNYFTHWMRCLTEKEMCAFLKQQC